MINNEISYKGVRITLVPVAHRLIDVYIGGVPRFCRNTSFECVRDAKATIDREGGLR